MQRRREKRVRGKSVDWDELKKPRTINLTDTTWEILQNLGIAMGGISRSEVIERLARDRVGDL